MVVEAELIFGKNVTAAAPGSAQGLYLVVSDMEAARDALPGRGVKISEVFHGAGSVYAAGTDDPYLLGGNGSAVGIPSMAATARSPRSGDPDGNGWLFQEVTTRLPGRIDPATTTFAAANDLACALRRRICLHGGAPRGRGAQGCELKLLSPARPAVRAMAPLFRNGSAVSLLTGSRHLSRRIILLHAGGLVPYGAHRFAELARLPARCS